MDSKDLAAWIGAIAAVISAGVAVLLLRQLSLAKDQLKASARQLKLAHEELKLNVRWNQLSAAFTYFGNKDLAERERPAAERLNMLKINLYHQQSVLSDDIVDTVLNDPEHFREVKDFLNFLEDYSTAVHVGVMDPEVSYSLMADLITRYYAVFNTMLKKRRIQIGNPRLWIEFEKLALQWEPRRVEEERRLVQEIQEAHERNEREIEDVREKEKQRMAAILLKTGATEKIYQAPHKDLGQI